MSLKECLCHISNAFQYVAVAKDKTQVSVFTIYVCIKDKGVAEP